MLRNLQAIQCQDSTPFLCPPLAAVSPQKPGHCFTALPCSCTALPLPFHTLQAIQSQEDSAAFAQVRAERSRPAVLQERGGRRGGQERAGHLRADRPRDHPAGRAGRAGARASRGRLRLHVAAGDQEGRQRRDERSLGGAEAREFEQSRRRGVAAHAEAAARRALSARPEAKAGVPAQGAAVQGGAQEPGRVSVRGHHPRWDEARGQGHRLHGPAAGQPGARRARRVSGPAPAVRQEKALRPKAGGAVENQMARAAGRAGAGADHDDMGGAAPAGGQAQAQAQRPGSVRHGAVGARAHNTGCPSTR